MESKKSDLVERYLSNEITAEEGERLRAFIADDPELQKLDLQHTYNTASLITASPRQGDLTIGTRGLRTWKRQRKQKRARHLVLQTLKYAAVLLLVIGVGYFVSEQRVDKELQKQLVVVEAPVGQSLLFSFKDGSTVRLSPYSRITMDASFGREKRMVTLEGAGFFEIAEDTKKPFVVRTKEGFDVEVTGTEFFLQSDHLQALHLSLLEGGVTLRGKGENYTEIALEPGESVTLLEGALVKRRETLSEIANRKHGIVEYDNHPLWEVFNDIGYWYDVQIVYADPALRYRTLSGKIRQGDSLRSILEAICHSLFLRYEFVDYNTIRISE